MIKRTLIGLSICLAILLGCSKSKEDQVTNPPGGGGNDCTGVNAKFAADVLPIIQSQCQGCHGAGSTNGPGALTTHAQISAAASRIKAAVVAGTMPKGSGPLPANQIKLISCWVDSGAPNN